jgi:hypothetical protein
MAFSWTSQRLRPSSVGLLHPRSRTFNASWGLPTSIVGLSKAIPRS